MSNVLKNRRSVSELEFYHNAVQFRAYLTRFVVSENNVPKKYRYVFTVPMTAKLTELFDNIIAANTIYPNDERNVEIRREYQMAAVINCEQILQLLQYMLETLPINVDKIGPTVEQIDREIGLLKAWRKATKVL